MQGNGDSLTASIARLLEQASDEVARLDSVADLAPRAFGLACRLEALLLREEASGEVAGSLGVGRSLVAASVEPLHEASLNATVRGFRDFVAEEERRVRGGGALSAARILEAGYAVADPATLDAALRPGGQARPVLLRATTAAAAITTAVTTAIAASITSSTPALSSAATGTGRATAVTPATLDSAVAALLLCGTGVTDHLRFLPFAGLASDARADALAEWQGGDPDAWTTVALTEAARAARERRLSITAALDAMQEHDERLDALGRAAITARRALAVLRDELATSIPALATRLDCSRPAASDALDRLVAAELATEVTDRARDRVFALTAALESAGIT